MHTHLRLREQNLAGPPAKFVRTASYDSALIKRLKLERLLNGHDGCVNTVSFSPGGELLVSGSDDVQIIFWDWQTGRQRLSWNSGHRNNVFQARILPFSSHKTVVSCAADGQVRVADVAEGGRVSTRRLATHEGRAHKLALNHDTPACFLSCGEDGQVMQHDLREGRGIHRKLLVCKGRNARVVDLNSIHINPQQPWQFVVGGSDACARVYDNRRTAGASHWSQAGRQPGTTGLGRAALGQPVRRLAPQHLVRDDKKHVHITCAHFSQQGEVLASYNDENIYLFAAETRASRAALAARRASHAEASCSAKRSHSSMAPPQSGLRRSSSGNHSQRPHQQARHEGSSPGTAGEELVDATVVSHEFIAPQPVTLESIGPQQTASPGAAEQDRPQLAAWPDAAEPSRSADEAAEIPATASQPGLSSQSAHEAVQAEGRESNSNAEPASQNALPSPAVQSHAAAPSGSPSSRPHTLQTDQSEPPDPGETAHSLEASSAEQEQHVNGHLHHRAMGPEESSRQHSAEHRQMQQRLQDAKETDVPRRAVTRSQLAALRRRELLNDDDDSGEDAELMELGPDPQPQLRPSALDFLPEPSADAEQLTLVNGITDDDSEEEEEEEDMDEDSEEASEDDDSDDDDDDEGSMPVGYGDAEDEEAGPIPDDSSLEDCVVQQYKGHRNNKTVKGVSFMGAADEWVVSGSDCGHIYIWDKASGKLQQWLHGDRHVVNCLEPHPTMPTFLATSGIENDIKIWSPTAEEVQSIPHEAHEVMQNNMRGQGQVFSRQMMLTPAALRRLLRYRNNPDPVERLHLFRQVLDESESSDEEPRSEGEASEEDTPGDAPRQSRVRIPRPGRRDCRIQ